MGRSHVQTVKQPDEVTCGPAALKTALRIFGKKSSLDTLRTLCRTNRFGTNTPDLIRAIRALGYAVLYIERANLRHLKTTLYPKTKIMRAVVIPYLYGGKHTDPHPESGHWATVSSYSNVQNRIVFFDSYAGSKKSYRWRNFRNRWWDYSMKRYHPDGGGRIAYRKQWTPGIMLVMARDAAELPSFRSRYSRVYPPKVLSV